MNDVKELILGLLLWGSIIVVSILINKHNEKAEKLEKLPYKQRYTRKQRIRNIKIKKFEKCLCKIFKPKLIFLLKTFSWLVLLGVILIVTSYDGYENKPNICAVLGLYILIVVQHYTDDLNYENWLQKAEYDEFYKRFCEQYHPHIIGYFIMYIIGLLCCNTIGFIACVFFCYIIDLWERRFITADIKQDMILENFKKLPFN